MVVLRMNCEQVDPNSTETIGSYSGLTRLLMLLDHKKRVASLYFLSRLMCKEGFLYICCSSVAMDTKSH